MQGGNFSAGSQTPDVLVTAPATDAARRWEGWGTALKPAHEPIVVARKPLVGTVAANVLEHGTGALNIDGCRVGTSDPLPNAGGRQVNDNQVYGKGLGVSSGRSAELGGRWPANLVLTHAADCGEACAEGCPVAELDGQSGVSKPKKQRVGRMGGHTGESSMGRGGDYIGTWPADPGGGASRFFTVTEWDPVADVAPFRYVAKPSKRERNAGPDGLPERSAAERYKTISTLNAEHQQRLPAQNHHPTVKPVALMRWLVRLVTPPGGTVLDPFLGSGTTAMAAVLEGFDWRGCEMTDEYISIIEGRVRYAESLTTTALPECTATEQPTQLLLI